MERWHSSVTMKSKVSMGTAGLYSMGSGALRSWAREAAEVSSLPGS